MKNTRAGERKGKPAADRLPAAAADGAQVLRRVCWTPVARPPGLRNSHVQIWRSPVTNRAWLEQCGTVLDTGEQERLRRFFQAADRDRFIAGRGMTRTVLSVLLGVPASRIVLKPDERGKPQIDWPVTSVRFSLSHSGGMVLTAFQTGEDPGLDVEQVRRMQDLEQTANRVLTEREREWVFAVEEGERQRRFLALWTRKEAVVKSEGGGLAHPLNAIDTLNDKIIVAQAEARHVVTFYPADGYIGSLATSRPPAEIAFFEPDLAGGGFPGEAILAG